MRSAVRRTSCSSSTTAQPSSAAGGRRRRDGCVQHLSSPPSREVNSVHRVRPRERVPQVHQKIPARSPFQSVKVEPPSVTTPSRSSRNPGKYEDHHRPSHRQGSGSLGETLRPHITGRFLPDKAIDVMERLAPRPHRHLNRSPEAELIAKDIEVVCAEKEKPSASSISKRPRNSATRRNTCVRTSRKRQRPWKKAREEKRTASMRIRPAGGRDWTGNSAFPHGKEGEPRNCSIRDRDSEDGRRPGNGGSPIARALRRSRADSRIRAVRSVPSCLWAHRCRQDGDCQTARRQMFGNQDALIQIA